MDLKSLNTFIQVAELNSFTRAGEKLGYSQPTISFQIKQLEKELGVQLFERIGHTVHLTDDGKDALSYAQHILRVSQEMVRGSNKRGIASGVIRMAMADSLCAPLLTGEFEKFRAEYPEIAVHVLTAGTDEMFRLLDHNEVDIVCTLDNHIYNTAYVIANEEKIGVHFICSGSNPVAQKADIMIQDLLSQAFLLTEKGMSYRRLLDEYLARSSIEIQPVLEIGSADLICKLVEEGVGISFLPDYVTEAAVQEKRLVRLPVRDFQVELWKQILYHRGKWMSLQMQAVLSHLSKISLKGYRRSN